MRLQERSRFCVMASRIILTCPNWLMRVFFISFQCRSTLLKSARLWDLFGGQGAPPSRCDLVRIRENMFDQAVLGQPESLLSIVGRT